MLMTKCHFQTMIYINDYPMHARRKVTTKVYMDEIIERTGVAFLSRGSHLLPGQENDISAAELRNILKWCRKPRVISRKLISKACT